MTACKTKKKPGRGEADRRFRRVVDAFSADLRVSLGESKGFGSGALKVNGRIFAMISSKGEFVVKLPKQRVDELVERNKGRRFDPGHGRLMKEWLVVCAPESDWTGLAREACDFVRRRP